MTLKHETNRTINRLQGHTPLHFTPLSENFALVPSTAGVDLMMLADVCVCDQITDKIIFLHPTLSALIQ